MHRSVRLALISLLLAGCSGNAAVKPVLHTDLVSHGTSAIVASNSARMSGRVSGFGPADLAAGYQTLATKSPKAIAGAQVEVFDENGVAVSAGPVTTDAAGNFTFRSLKASPPVLFLRATIQAGDQVATLRAIALAPRATARDGILLDPGTTLVTKKCLALQQARVLAGASLDALTAAKAGAFLAPLLDTETAINAQLHEDFAAGKDLDAFLAAHLDDRNELDRIVGTSLLSHLLDPTPDQPAAANDGHSLGISVAPAPNPAVEAPGTTHVAGGPEAGFADGDAASARFGTPYDVCTGPDGTLYVADSDNNAVRKIAPDGTVSTLAGGGDASFADGKGAAARFSGPSGVALGDDGTLYVADYGNHRVRQVAADGTVTTLAGTGAQSFADGPGLAAKLGSPADLALDGKGHLLFADTDDHRIRSIDLLEAAHPVTTLAGSGTQGFLDGPAGDAQLSGPQDVAVGPNGDVYFADTGNHAIRRIAMGDVVHRVSTVAGNGSPGYLDGSGTNARLNTPYGLAIGPAGTIYVADANNNSLRLVTASGAVSTYWGGTTPDRARPIGLFHGPSGVAIRRNAAGVVEVFIADANNNAVRKIALEAPAAAAGSDPGFTAK